MPRFNFTITGDIEAADATMAEAVIERAFEKIDPNVEIDLTEQEEEVEKDTD